MRGCDGSRGGIVGSPTFSLLGTLSTPGRLQKKQGGFFGVQLVEGLGTQEIRV